MKKIFQSEKWKKYSELRTRSELKRRRKKKIFFKKYYSSEHFSFKPKEISYTEQTKKRIKKTIKAPTDFSIVNNTDEMLPFFKEYFVGIKEGKRIFFDMTSITSMTEDAILYMLSRFHYSKMKYGHNFVSGNVPNNIDCRRLLQESGFYKHVFYNGNMSPPSGKIFAIETKHLVHGETAKEVMDFARNRLKSKNITKASYPIMIECMANTLNHAFTTKASGSTLSKWWLIAMHSEETKTIHFTFLDNGLGIPNTIRKRLSEILVGIFIELDDSALIVSALKGEFRTQTNFKWRGKGLPNILKYVRNNEIKNLKIISNHGYVLCNGEEIKSIKLENRFYGTLLSWDISYDS
ncbi:MAG: hypothetical protein JW927_18660 [Deltaproteobacteria bacterium]|nr:hypothetical protein [Deltaproteobacteria bacterium]